MTSTSFPAILTTEKVPLVHLKTSGYISYYSDSGGVVAFDEPGLVGLDVYFVVESDGYVRQPPHPPRPQPLRRPANSPILLDIVSALPPRTRILEVSARSARFLSSSFHADTCNNIDDVITTLFEPTGACRSSTAKHAWLGARGPPPHLSIRTCCIAVSAPHTHAKYTTLERTHLCLN